MKDYMNLIDKVGQDELLSFTTQWEQTHNQAETFKYERIPFWCESMMYMEGNLPAKNARSFTDVLNLSTVSKGVAEKYDYVFPAVYDCTKSILPIGLDALGDNCRDNMVLGKRTSALNLPTEIIDLTNDGVDECLFGKNKGRTVIARCMEEAVLAGDTFGKVCQKEYTKTYKGTIVQEAPLMELQIKTDNGDVIDFASLNILSMDDVDLSKAKATLLSPEEVEFAIVMGKQLNPEEENYVYSGKITVTERRYDIKVERVPFYEIYVDAENIDTSLDEANYVGQRILMKRSQLLDYGFTEEQAMAAEMASFTEEDAWTNQYMMTQDSVSTPLQTDSSVDPMNQSVFLYETYLRSSLLEGEDHMYQVYSGNRYPTKDGKSLYSIKRVDYQPYVHGIVDTLPDSFWGTGVYHHMKPIQDQLTKIYQAIYDNGRNANGGRYIVLKGGYDRRSLMDNREGGIIEVTAPGAITPMPYHNLPAGLLEMKNDLLQQVETFKSIVINNNSIGSAVANASATGMAIADDNSKAQGKRYISTFKDTFMIPMISKIYDIIKADSLYYLGIPDGNLPDVYEIDIKVMTKQDKVYAAKNIEEAVLAAAAADPSIVTPDNFYNVYGDMLSAYGTVDVTRYLTKPAAPDQAALQKQMRMAEEDRELQVESTKTSIAHMRSETAKNYGELAHKKTLGDCDKMETLRKTRVSNFEMEYKSGLLQQGQVKNDLEGRKLNLDITNAKNNQLNSLLDRDPQVLIHNS